MANYPHNDDVLLNAFYRLIIVQLATDVHSNQTNSGPLATCMKILQKKHVFDGQHGPLSLCYGPFIGLSLSCGALSPP